MALAMSASMASAATTVTFTGKIAQIDTTGNYGIYFGGAVGAGTAYSLVYTINDADGGTVLHPDAYTTRLEELGAVTAVMTINGYSQSVGGTNSSFVYATNAKPVPPGGLVDGIGAQSKDFTYRADDIYRSVYASSGFSSYLTDFLSAADYHSPFSVPVLSGDSYGNSFHINDFDYVRNVGSSIFLNLAPEMVSVAVTRVEEPGAPPVPEPASWAMMIGGFALAGGVLRQQRAAARLIAA
jgi:hypothetical protein